MFECCLEKTFFYKWPKMYKTDVKESIPTNAADENMNGIKYVF